MGNSAVVADLFLLDARNRAGVEAAEAAAGDWAARGLPEALALGTALEAAEPASAAAIALGDSFLFEAAAATLAEG